MRRAACALGLGQWNNNTHSLALRSLSILYNQQISLAHDKPIPRFSIFLFSFCLARCRRAAGWDLLAGQPCSDRTQKVHVHHLCRLENNSRCINSITLTWLRVRDQLQISQDVEWAIECLFGANLLSTRRKISQVRKQLRCKSISLRIEQQVAKRRGLIFATFPCDLARIIVDESEHFNWPLSSNKIEVRNSFPISGVFLLTLANQGASFIDWKKSQELRSQLALRSD